MRRIAILIALPLLLLSSLTSAEPRQTDKKPLPPMEADVRLMDTSTVRTVIVQDKIDIVTKYGKLTVPTRDILCIDMGVHLDPEEQAQVARLIDHLDSEQYKTREIALKDLVELGPIAYPQICAAVKSEKHEVAKRAAMAVDKIKAKNPPANLRLRDFDVVTTTTFPIHGCIIPPSLRVRNGTFGEVDLKLTQVRVIRWIGASSELDVAVDAGSYGSLQNKWMETEFEARSGIRLVITATGSVDLWPQGGSYSSTPRGYNANGPSPPDTQFKAGSLLGRIGADGPAFLIGDYFDGVMSRNGKLHLHIVPSPWNNPSSGSYQVKIKARDDFGDY